MSVIIKGMAMPETCYECRFCEGHSEYPFKHYCAAHLNYIEDPRDGRLDTCPLEEIPKCEIDNIKAQEFAKGFVTATEAILDMLKGKGEKNESD